ncbi:hypothetical protein Acj133p204 [Acinetobacter phage 133]|uniref:Uncharacterized protein n=1 Tax=Acinetobacter phage 133 TaxID=2919552 RepID=D9I6D8_9CAUD|nr:hypothetical protein Acj133p204 [Acinetobacter phage 133]ADJ19519.1 hypothetical protein Acj133p204 [Acinetobacter phage 133]
MKTFRELHEDAQHAGYKEYKSTPRKLGPKDQKFFDLNKDKSVGDEIQLFNGQPLKGSKILQVNKNILQYSHIEENELHIESVEMKEGRWNSLHLPANAGPLIKETK